MNGSLVELIMSFRVKMIADSTVYTMSDWFHAKSRERFHLKTKKQYVKRIIRGQSDIK